MKFENIKVFNFEGALRGMRNPMNSWHLADSNFNVGTHDEFMDVLGEYVALWHPGVENLPQEFIDNIANNAYVNDVGDYIEWAFIGPKDMKCARGLIQGGPEHRKFMRQIMVSVDITAPLYWWKEFDTYKIGTTANSTSTMHKITSKPITIDCFEVDDFNNIEYPAEAQRKEIKSNCDNDFVQMCLIPYLEYLRQQHLMLKDVGNEQEAKKVWKELIRWLPNGWLQTRTVTLNYENLRTIYHQRENHKLTEWRIDFIDRFIKELPYAEEFIIN